MGKHDSIGREGPDETAGTGASELGPNDVVTDDELTAEELEQLEDEDFEPEHDEPTTSAALLWTDTEISPVEVALPSGVGLTLRHYRVVEDSDGEEVEEAMFLAHKGRLHLFRSAEGLITFINSDAPHGLTDLPGWDRVRREARAADVVADEEDRYELDLVVENLRNGHDVWEAELLIPAGELARDVAFACDLNDVLSALAAGSPLDDLDEDLRAGGFLAKRRLKKIGAEQAAIGWRGVIGKITAAVEWHD